MNLEIYKNGSFTKIDPNKAPRTFKELRGFLVCNEGKDCFMKSQGKVWKITTKVVEVCRTIQDLSFNYYLKLSLQND